ncbi:MAG: TIGR03617 family F420-dependent LLM class oxidoreductase [Dehalococcoidia bacterium]
MQVYMNIPSRPIEATVKAAVKAEELGYDGVLTSETKYDPFLPLVAAAQATSRVKLGTAIAIAFPRSPMAMAKTAWDLQAMSNGRFELGLGTQVRGHMVRRFSTPWTKPIPRMRQYVEAMRAIWDTWQNGSRLRYESENYSFNLMTPHVNPGPIEHPDIPVKLAAVTPAMGRMAGRCADGILMHGINTVKYNDEKFIPAIKEGLAQSDRSLDEFAMHVIGFYTAVRDDQALEKVRAGLRRTIAFYGSTRTYRTVFDTHGWGDMVDRLYELSLKGQTGSGQEGLWEKEMVEIVTDDVFDAFTVIGTYDDMGQRLKERFGGFASKISFSIPLKTPEDEEALKAIIRELHAS